MAGLSGALFTVGGLLLVGGVGLALSGRQAAAPAPTGGVPPPPPPQPQPVGGTQCPPSVTGAPPQLYVVHDADNGKAVTIRQGDVLRASLLLPPPVPDVGVADWTVASSDSGVLELTQVTTGPDPTSPHGTDRVSVFRTTGRAGIVTLTGQLLQGPGLIQPQPNQPPPPPTLIRTWSVTVHVQC